MDMKKGARRIALGTALSATMAAAINISGTVTESVENTAVEGAKVSLIISGLSAETDAQGAYSLVQEEAVSSSSSAQDTTTLAILTAGKFSNSNYEYRAFNLMGRHISSGNAPRYGVTLQVSGNKVMGVQSRYLAKDAAFSDTLLVEKDGYLSQRIALDNETATVNVSLDTISVAVEPVKFEADGYASQNGGTTGGAGGDTVEVSTYAEFKAAIQTDDPKVVVVKGTIKTTDGDGYGLPIYSNTTIMGKDSSATIYGGLVVKGKTNVIIYNLNIHGTYPDPGPSDGIAVNGGSTNVWITHVNIWDAEDGNLDITGQASYVTVSYVHFWYTLSSHPHRLNALIGSGASDHPEDFGKLKVTYHHCWFGTLVNERMPRVMYGNAHIYNNYYTATDNLYCVGVGSYGSALIESNYFYKSNNPIVFMYNVYAYINTKNNKYDGVSQTYSGTVSSGTTNVGANDGGVKYGERYITTDPYTLTEDPVVLDNVPYEYTADNVSDVPTIVKRDAGPHNL